MLALANGTCFTISSMEISASFRYILTKFSFLNDGTINLEVKIYDSIDDLRNKKVGILLL